MMHTEEHPFAGQTVGIRFADPGHPQVDGMDHEFRVEDWWDRVAGKSWMFSDGNPAALSYALRSGAALLPIDDDVVYGKIGAFGHLVHRSEIVRA